jgi:acyl-CoA reductase-like NAD-dependent aldehyde dehydrogenase
VGQGDHGHRGRSPEPTADQPVGEDATGIPVADPGGHNCEQLLTFSATGPTIDTPFRTGAHTQETRSMPEVLTEKRIFVGGEFTEPAGSELLTVVAPATEQVIGEVPRVTTADVDRAVSAARSAFDDGPWPRLSLDERIAAVLRLADALERRVEEITPIAVAEMGAPVSGSGRGAAAGPPRLVRAIVDMARTFPYVEDRRGPFGHALVVREPVGVVGVIVPWNGPLFMGMLNMVPALLAGCTGVVKLGPETSLIGYPLAEAIAEAGFPPGVLSVLAADREPSEHLVTHPQVDKISFTGSTATGRRIAALCGNDLRRYTLELGGKSAAILLPDGDLDTLYGAVRQSALGTNGQQCFGMTRVLAPRSRYAETVDHLVAEMGALTVGDPADPATDIGPLISARQRDRVLHMIDAGRAEGARVALGGGNGGRSAGWYVEPTVFAEVDNRMSIAQEEFFAPVICAIPYDDEDHAVALANDSQYGLGGGVFTADVERGIAIGRRVRTGHFSVNGFFLNFQAPFGGFKASGIGREYGPEGLGSYTEIKSINLPS